MQVLQTSFRQNGGVGPSWPRGHTAVTCVVISHADETTNEFVTIGEYVQEELGLRDRIFFTGVPAHDRNSAFGSSFRQHRVSQGGRIVG